MWLWLTKRSKIEWEYQRERKSFESIIRHDVWSILFSYFTSFEMKGEKRNFARNTNKLANPDHSSYLSVAYNVLILQRLISKWFRLCRLGNTSKIYYSFVVPFVLRINAIGKWIKIRTDKFSSKHEKSERKKEAHWHQTDLLDWNEYTCLEHRFVNGNQRKWNGMRLVDVNGSWYGNRCGQ